ncbi:MULTISPECIES: hypothetical protein [unclassified Bradyrhizobium]|uniref:hypothetical protein n=1 Tax=unclassified Bradyrhizobium TaxID=2631580 RepID=UPI0028E4522D|nr:MULTISPECIES: hypothetical protein [unclassified Bradyrhizobium]
MVVVESAVGEQLTDFEQRLVFRWHDLKGVSGKHWSSIGHLSLLSGFDLGNLHLRPTQAKFAFKRIRPHTGGMGKSEIVNGLPWFSTKQEREIFTKLGFCSVYAVGPDGGRPLRIGVSANLQSSLKTMQLGCWKELQVHHIIWVDGELLANRIAGDVCGVFDKGNRRLAGSWFDVTAEFAVQAMRLSTDKSRIRFLSHGEMLEQVRSVRKRKIEEAIARA